ncbi:MAG: aldo/keto reductase [Caldilineaceae bacterium]
MEYGSVPGVDKPISRLVQGTVMVNSNEMEQSFALLDGVRALGCTTFDTGHIYGNGDNERTVETWVRDRGVLETWSSSARVRTTAATVAASPPSTSPPTSTTRWPASSSTTSTSTCSTGTTPTCRSAPHRLMLHNGTRMRAASAPSAAPTGRWRASRRPTTTPTSTV